MLLKAQLNKKIKIEKTMEWLIFEKYCVSIQWGNIY